MRTPSVLAGWYRRPLAFAAPGALAAMLAVAAPVVAPAAAQTQPATQPAPPAAPARSNARPNEPGPVVNSTPIASGAGPLMEGMGALPSGFRLNTTDEFRSARVAAPPDSVWLAVKQAYANLKMPATTLVDADRRIAMQNRRSRDKLAGERLSKLVTCGQAMDGRDAAESYEVILDVLTLVTPDAGGSAVHSAVTAVAKPVFTSGDPVRCVSTGRLESVIASAAEKRAAKP